MTFETALSGLNNSSKALDVISNNIANASTVGFKAAQVGFADLFAASVAGTARAPGLGAISASISQSFTQGNVSSSNNPVDMAISGQGFFRMTDDSGAVSYTRNGQFHLTGEPIPEGTTLTPEQLAAQPSLLVNSDGLHVTGYLADASGVIQTTSTPQDISIAPVLAGSATTTVATQLNLDAGETQKLDAQGNVPTFDPLDVSTFNSATTIKAYDTDGVEHSLGLYFVKTATPNTWDLYSTLDGGAATGPDVMAFSSAGALTSSPITLAFGATLPSVTLDFSGSSQYGVPFGINSQTQDGYANGSISRLLTGRDGVIEATYTNGQTRKVAQVVLAGFANPGGLESVGRNQWRATLASGAVKLDTPANTNSATSLGLGTIKGAAVEEANVDLGEELVNMIVQQRFYQANAQAIKAQDQLLQTLGGVR